MSLAPAIGCGGRADPDCDPPTLSPATEYSEIVIGGASIASLWTRLERVAILTFAIVVAGVEITILVRLLYEMASRPSNLDAVVLLWTAVDLWLINVVLFTLIYWRLDRGGPDGRAGSWRGAADFHFPRGDAADGVAFSPSEIYPLSDRAKALHIVQSMISPVVIVALASRAIGILGQ